MSSRSQEELEYFKGGAVKNEHYVTKQHQGLKAAVGLLPNAWHGSFIFECYGLTRYLKIIEKP